jgi:uncharacterized protein
MKSILSTTVAAAAIAVAALAAPAEAASFDCRTADTAAERTICRHQRLSLLDERMSKLYFAVHDRISEEQREQLLDTQRRFLDARFDCGHDARCLGYAYEVRIGELGDLLQTVREDLRRQANPYHPPYVEPRYNPYKRPAY